MYFTYSEQNPWILALFAFHCIEKEGQSKVQCTGRESVERIRWSWRHQTFTGIVLDCSILPCLFRSLERPTKHWKSTSIRYKYNYTMFAALNTLIHYMPPLLLVIFFTGKFLLQIGSGMTSTDFNRTKTDHIVHWLDNDLWTTTVEVTITVAQWIEH